MYKTEYSLYKAVGENLLKQAEKSNYTIVCHAITYSKRRFQLTILEAQILVERMCSGKTVVLPEQAMTVQGTMSWAGDVAKMLARLMLNKDAFGEVYIVSTAEHRSWGEIERARNSRSLCHFMMGCVWNCHGCRRRCAGSVRTTE